MRPVRPILLTVVTSALVALAPSCGDDTSTPVLPPATGGGGSGASGGAGGGDSDGGNLPCVPGLTAIALEPADSVVTLDGVAAAPITFVATGTFADAHTETLNAALLQWTATREDDADPGKISGGVLEPNPLSGGVVTVKAQDGCIAGSTTVTFKLNATIGTPSDPGAWGGTPVTDAPVPKIVYPSDETRFPRNVYRILFQWLSEGFTEFRLTFQGPNSTVVIYTDGADPTCIEQVGTAGCWEADEKAWSYIASSNAGATASWTVDALDKSTTPATVRRSSSIDIGFSKQDVKGAIFYWSTTSAGVRRGKISKLEPEDYIVGKPPTTYPDGDAVKCVACHVVSRDGQYLAAPVSAASGGSLWIAKVTPQAPPEPLVKDVPDTGGHGFATISIDNTHVVAAWKGRMWLLDRATGAYINEVPSGELEGTHPDFSPLNDELLFATGSGDGPGGASLARIPFQNGTWGQPEVFLPPLNGLSNLFPMFSPEGAWITFANGKGGHGDQSAQLFMIASKGGGAPIELINANRITNNETTDGMYQNSQPTWAPPGDYHWIAFNTKRAYGVVLGEGKQQIWVAAIDVNKAKNGEDPSFPAFRVPFQGLNENNHRAFWTLDINEPGGAGGAGGGTGGGGGAGGGGPQPCPENLQLGDPCDPLFDCCTPPLLICDTLNDGATYECVDNSPT